jgi:hypothetical protein
MKGFIWKIGMVATAIATIIPSGLAYGESDPEVLNGNYSAWGIGD